MENQIVGIKRAYVDIKKGDIDNDNNNNNVFIQKAILIHGDKYDYSNVHYINNKTKVIINCNIHGKFTQTPHSHLSNSGCPSCSGTRLKTTEQFIQEAIAVHGNKYDYSNVHYINNKTKVIIICNIHGVFTQKPNSHLMKQGCPSCGSRTKTSEQFIQEAIAVHGNKYDYSNVNYVNNNTKVIIICNIHGAFTQKPNNHLLKQGCPTCGYLIRTKTSEQFIQEAIAIHGNKYDYSCVKYINNNTHVTIICNDHGEFQQVPNNHLNNHGCPTCSGNILKTTEQFIQEAIAIHGEKYDYSRVNYLGAKIKVTIICNDHGEFPQEPNSHLNKSGCPTCSGNILITTEQFIQEARLIHGDKYDYSNVNYINSNKKVTILCNIHGAFLQTPKSHIHRKQGCPICYGNILKTTEQFICDAIQVHGNKYDYSNVNYVNNKTKVIIICNIHRAFLQTPNQHLNKNGCPDCANAYQSWVRSKPNEQFIRDARAIHGDKYDYSNVNYINCKKKVTILCNIHGAFTQSPTNHLRNNGCPICYGTIRKTTEQFIQDARAIHGDKYDYSQVTYTSNKTKITILCNIHGAFTQTPNSHLRNHGCPICYGNSNKTTEQFIQNALLIHGNKYDYSNTNYVNSRIKVSIICNIHGAFTQNPRSHLQNHGCPSCYKN